MDVINHIQDIRDKLHQHCSEKASGIKVGLIPTMGYLHQGHMSLLKQAKEECDIIVLSIFVNPLQFGPKEDLASYPKDLQRDLSIAEQMNADIVFTPAVDEMYPQPIKTNITVSGVTEGLCGASRPGHFDGVATVVMKLLQIVQPNRVYFGLKNAQQTAVIQQMVFDLNINIDVVLCETLREADGLAMSSRNVKLSAEERKQAVVLFQALQRAEQLVKEKTGLTKKHLIYDIKELINQSKLAAIDYVDLLVYPSLTACKEEDEVAALLKQGKLILALAVKFGNTRLIDNRIFSP